MERCQDEGARVEIGFHTGMAIAFLATAFAGFAPSYYLRGLSDRPPLSPLLHVHGLVFTGWLVLFLVQTLLVASRRVDLHRRLGIGAAVLGASMVPLGMATAVAAARRGSSRPGIDPLAFLIFPLGQVVLFAVFLGAALWWRRRAEAHRRLVLLATVSLLTPAIARIPLVGEHPIVSLAVSVVFVAVAMVHDRRSRGRVHPILAWGAVVLLASGPLRFALSRTEAWHALARSLVG